MTRSAYAYQGLRINSGSLAIFAAIRASGGPVLLGSELAGGRAAAHDADFSGAVYACCRGMH